MKRKRPIPEKKSAAAAALGGQPETDRDAREAGFPSATAPDPAGHENVGGRHRRPARRRSRRR